MSTSPAADPVTVEEHLVDGRDGTVRVRDYRPTSPAATPFLWVHGGGFTSGGLDQKESDAPARLLAAAGIPVRTLEYRLAPRANPWKDPDLSFHPGRYPAGLHDVIDTAKNLIDQTGGPITIGGASAGADLAAGAVLSLRDQGSTAFRSVVLAYPTLHAEIPPNDAVERELRGVLAKWAFNPKMTRRMNLNYVGDPALLVPGYAFPGGADLHDFPPTLILNAANDRLRRSGAAFADELRAAGTEVQELLIPGTHAFLDKPKSDEFALGIRYLTEWLSSTR